MGQDEDADRSMPGVAEGSLQLERIVSSEGFVSAPRLARFLRHVVTVTLQGQADRLNSYEIGVEALGKTASFDPETDPSVHVTAARVRRALARYYATDGKRDRLVIKIPPGSYVPVFRTALERNKEPASSGTGLRQALSSLSYRLLSSRFGTGLSRRAGASRAGRRFADIAHGAPNAASDGMADAVTLLHDLTVELSTVKSPDVALESVIDGMIRLQGAQLGSLQLLDRTGSELRIVTHRGFKDPFLRHFAKISTGASPECFRNMQAGGTLVIEDVSREDSFAASRPMAAEAGFRAVQSTPLVASGGRLIGVASTYFARPHRPTRVIMLATGVYARFAAERLADLLPPDGIYSNGYAPAR